MAFQAVSESEAPGITPAVKALITISVAVFFVQVTLYADAAQMLGFTWDGFVSKRHVWTIFTYLFVQDKPSYLNAWFLALNMYALLLFGPRLERSWSTRRFALFYLICGIGPLCCVAFMRGSGVIIGPSGAIFGVMTAFAMQWPNDEIFFLGVIPMRVWTMVILLIGANLAMGLFGPPIDSPSSMVYFAHLGGVVAGWFYVRTLDTPTLAQLRQHVARVPDTEDPPRPIPRSHPRTRDRVDNVEQIVARSKAIAAKRSAVAGPQAQTIDATADEVDRVLDKISKHGIASLTSDERQMLEEMSKRLRGS